MYLILINILHFITNKNHSYLRLKMENENAEFDKDLKLIAKSSVVVFLGILLSKVFTYVYRIIIAREFSPADYGLFTISAMITGWFIALSNVGLNQGLARYIPLFRGKNQPEKIKSSCRYSFALTAIASTISAILLFIFAETISINFFHDNSLITFLKFFAIVIPLTVILEIILSVVLAYEEVGWYSFIHKILIGFLKIVLLIAFIAIGFSVSSIFFSFILSLFIALVISFFLVKYKFPYLFTKDDKSNWKKEKIFGEVFSYSWPLLFYGITWSVFHWTDSFLLGYFATAADVGIYNAAVPIAFIMTATTQTFMQIFFPVINREHAKNNNKTVKQLSQQVGKWIFMINLPILLLLVLFPEAFLNILFGHEYISAKSSLIFLSIGTLFFSVFNVSNSLIAMGGKSKTVLFDVLAASALNIILNILLIPSYGITGAAIATMISLITLGVIFSVQSMIYFSIIPIRRKMANIGLAAIISTLLLLYIKSMMPINYLSMFVLALFFLVSYIFLVFLFKGLDKNDIMVAKSMLKKLKGRTKTS